MARKVERKRLKGKEAVSYGSMRSESAFVSFAANRAISQHRDLYIAPLTFA